MGGCVGACMVEASSSGKFMSSKKCEQGGGGERDQTGALPTRGG